ncbi:hypothetical protein ACGFJ5_12040 [Micromonospora echinaurantiaca]|uniref:hypothetical protein n=1 Tax=Micromonospora echinaurantiaca TaxID=47857 RepID=UPI003718F1FC
MLRNVSHARGSFVFTTPIGTPLDPRNCTRLVQTEREAAGLPAIRLHDLRHGCVAALLALGSASARRGGWHVADRIGPTDDGPTQSLCLAS